MTLLSINTVSADEQTPAQVLEAIRQELACGGCQRRVFGDIQTVVGAPAKEFVMASHVNGEGVESVQIIFSTPEQAPSMPKPMAGVEYLAQVPASKAPPAQFLWDPSISRTRRVDQGPNGLILSTNLIFFSLTPWAYFNVVEDVEDINACKKAKYVWSKGDEVGEIIGKPCVSYLQPISLWAEEVAPGRWVLKKMVFRGVAGSRVFEYFGYQQQGGFFQPSSMRVTGPEGDENNVRFICWEIEKGENLPASSSLLSYSGLGNTKIPMPVCGGEDAIASR